MRRGLNRVFEKGEPKPELAAASFTAYLSEFLTLLRAGAKPLSERVAKIFDDIIAWLDELVAARKIDWMSTKFFHFGSDENTIRNLIRLQKRADDGWFNILAHGDAKHIIIDGRKYKPQQFANMLKELGYDGQKPIRLIACETGSKPTGFAKRLAEILKVDVQAPTKRIAIDDLSEFVHFDKGKFITFKP
jgi:hypothetical protein